MSMFTTAKLTNTETEALIASFTGTVTVCRKGRKSLVKTFRHPGSLSNKGMKSVSLKNSGLYLR